MGARKHAMNPNPEVPLQQKSWFGRNWGWVLAAAVGLPIMCCGGFGAFTYFTAKKMVESSAVYVDVMARTAMDSRIADALGEPVQPGLPSNSSVKESGDTGTAELVIPFTGQKGSATLYANATKQGGRWDYSRLEMVLADGTSIDLTKAPAMEEPPEDAAPPADEPAPTDDAPADDAPEPATE